MDTVGSRNTARVWVLLIQPAAMVARRSRPLSVYIPETSQHSQTVCQAFLTSDADLGIKFKGPINKLRLTVDFLEATGLGI